MRPDTPILLDSNAYLWLLYDGERIGPGATEALQAASAVYVSIVSLWELAMKHAKGLLPYSPKQLQDGLVALGAELLPIEPRHVAHLQNIQLPQKDPFDTLLVAQSDSEQYLFMTADHEILQSAYTVMDITL